jgi:glycosyltransferase involved in cell wall biosynthesis
MARVVGALAHAQARHAHSVTVATTDVCDSTSRLRPPTPGVHSRWHVRIERTGDGIDVMVFPNVSNAFAYRWQFFLPVSLAGFVRRHARDFDIAHLHACHNLLTSLAGRRLALAGVPYVIQPNGTAPLIERRRVAKRAFDLVMARNLLRRAAAVVAVTECERRQLQKLNVAASRIRIVPNPVAPAPLDALPPPGSFRRRHALKDGPLVLFLGILSPRKQPAILARAVSELGRPDVQLVFAGNDMGCGRLTRQVVRRLGLDSQTRFTGLLKGPDRFSALADADIVVYPSRDEVFGLVPLEALQTGTPVIVCNDCGCGEIINSIGGGLVVPPCKSRELSAALFKMLSDLPRWRHVAEGTAREIARRFHPDVVSTEMEHVYLDAIGRS